MTDPVSKTSADDPVDLSPPRLPDDRSVDLHDLGFVGRVSDEALAEIDAAERRAGQVIQTATRWWFR